MQHRTIEQTDWPAWARRQLLGAIMAADAHAAGNGPSTLAGRLYHSWFTPPVVETPRALLRLPLVGLYRQAHAGSTRRVVDDDEVQVIDRRDVLGRDRWWRTWGSQWSPSRSRSRSVRLLLSPEMAALPEFVHVATAALLGLDQPWLLAMPTLPSRLRHSGSAVIYLPDDAGLHHDISAALSGYMRADTPPLCLPLAPGVALAEDPGNGMTFGEHRSHLVALALEPRPREPLRAIAEVFGAHGLSSAEPHRSSGLG
ncbi:T3SS effector HopA1 family protein [Jatrophihabitans sp.]|uniref:T3SS effector HopA1 family protein n=1 Tax=Jatrophihabitans sp. TaxID=1932789 RepID=UPI0030C6A857|nr:hypothetical protein [Jatrophihabitans sp.]